MWDSSHHPPDLRRVGQDAGLAYPAEPELCDLVEHYLAPEDDRPSGVAFSDAGPLFRYTDTDRCEGLRLVRDGSRVLQSPPARVD